MEAPSAATTPAKRRRITIFRESAAPSLEESGTMVNNSSSVANMGLYKMMQNGFTDGYIVKCLFKSPEPNGFSLTYGWFKGNYPLPPHTHSTDCLYYVISGELHMGKDVLGAGDGFFLPAETGYSYKAGPDGLEILEFRDSTKFDITVGDANDAAWERLAKVCAANQDLWKTQRPPVRLPRVSAP